ncbi:MAG: DNA cytosine methyltransferase [Xanthomonadaceae bacterium]|nr:DNA cytosine methyltransferase [Xanthomonadaceae bacterium]
MDLELRWSPEASEDLEAIAEYIARDSGHYARAVVSEVLSVSRTIAEFPFIGRTVPEIGDENIRERFVYSYRLVYRIDPKTIKGGYRVGALVIDAKEFLPQSRPRLFIVGTLQNMTLPDELHAETPHPAWHPRSLIKSVSSMPSDLLEAWVWWQMPMPESRTAHLIDLIEHEPEGVKWHTPQKTEQLLEMMSPLHQRKVQAAQRIGKVVVGTIYRRSRPNGQTKSVQRAEVRFDGTAGCLRTPSGGSSRQTIILIEGKSIQTRLLSPREAARLMGLPETYQLPKRYNDAYHLAGDGLAVPVVDHLARHLLAPIVDHHLKLARREAA